MAHSVNWLKLNMNGLIQGDPGMANASNLIRDSDGHLVARFIYNVGSCYPLIAKIMGALAGFKMA